MNHLTSRIIPISPLAEPAPETRRLMVAVLQQIAGELARLAREPAHVQIIDLSSLPLGEPGTKALSQALGRGEVVVEVRSAALTRIHETAYPGVWWQSQGPQEDAEATGRLQSVVVAAVPPLVAAPPQDVAHAHAALLHLLFEPSPELEARRRA